MDLSTGEVLSYSSKKLLFIGKFDGINYFEKIDENMNLLNDFEKISDDSLQEIIKNYDYKVSLFIKSDFKDMAGNVLKEGDMFIDRESEDDYPEINWKFIVDDGEILIYLEENDEYEEMFYNKEEFKRDCLIVKNKNTAKQELKEFLNLNKEESFLNKLKEFFKKGEKDGIDIEKIKNQL